MSISTHAWAVAISKTPLSVWLQHQWWVVPVSQSVHIIGVSVVFASAMVISLRTLGVGTSTRGIPHLIRTLAPWMYGGWMLLILTGTLQTFIEPARQFSASVFWLKMILILCVVPLTTTFMLKVDRHPEAWSDPANTPLLAKLFALASLAMWVGIIYCGRFIGYTYTAA